MFCFKHRDFYLKISKHVVTEVKWFSKAISSNQQIGSKLPSSNFHFKKRKIKAQFSGICDISTRTIVRSTHWPITYSCPKNDHGSSFPPPKTKKKHSFFSIKRQQNLSKPTMEKISPCIVWNWQECVTIEW